MGPDREMAEAEADVSKGGSERVEEGGDLRERVKAHWEAIALMAMTLTVTLGMGPVYLSSLKS